MFWISKRDVLEDFAIIAGLIGVQFVYAGNSAVLSYLLALGLQSSTLIILSSFGTFLVLSPISYSFERRKWPKKISLKLLIQLVLISLGGTTIFQSLFLKGIKLTTPATATAMPNLAPGFIFIIAWVCRLEKVNVKCMYSKAKIVGTLLCVVGAILMTIMQSTKQSRMAEEAMVSESLPDEKFFDDDKFLGFAYLMAAVFVLSSNVVLQAATLGDFPAPISLSAITSLFGGMITVVIQLIKDQRMEIGWPILSVTELMAYSLMAGTIGGVCVSFCGWAIKKKGPVLVSIFNPIGAVISVILSFITLGQAITLGSLVGMFTMFAGLYFVLWAKGMESSPFHDDFDVRKPLLS